MNRNLRKQADAIVQASIAAVLPDRAVRRALEDFTPGPGKTLLVAAGKAAWQMAHAAVEALGGVDGGVVVTKYGHVKGEIPGVVCCEAGHPVPDENSFAATAKALELVRGLTAEDTVLFLLSGGGSALFEKPLIPGDELQDITRQLLASGADIVAMNTIRKRLSAVKGGRFAQACAPAQVYSIVLSDILGDPLDMIASGPAYPDSSTCEEAAAIARRYGLQLSPAAQELLGQETPKALDNVTTRITGSVRELCAAAAEQCRALGYEPLLLTDCLDCEAREAGRFLADVLRTHAREGRKLAFLAGGETVVHLTGQGLGGRNQELALAAAPGLAGLENAAVFSVGSDGTDGPTDAAGGYVDGTTMEDLRAKGLDVFTVLQQNDAYHALQAVDGLLITGPTGTNVNDVAVTLLDA
ncbi:glycerate kinase type-2 family protein [Subdoligranulum variabile]|uniref:MOFRL family protein n=1 Tax=Subdoligranulum variabile DSM 15176 TaxID=411471 RepID=D1PID7_9FIRM|nr:glycerate kinase [Subdoligranulum variabile]EFB77522.1 MOFRL family protein [Subdoligranulum variabile DSM 15176]UWP67201.1 glycerate kinase [Subdoligranulum variabile]